VEEVGGSEGNDEGALDEILPRLGARIVITSEHVSIPFTVEVELVVLSTTSEGGIDILQVSSKCLLIGGLDEITSHLFLLGRRFVGT
jgi:hypothetical protein